MLPFFLPPRRYLSILLTGRDRSNDLSLTVIFTSTILAFERSLFLGQRNCICAAVEIPSFFGIPIFCLFQL